MMKDLTVKGLILGFTAGLITALFDGLFMLISNVYIPYSYPILLLTLNTLLWTTIGGLSGLSLCVFARYKEHVMERENFFWSVFFLFPFSIIYGMLGRIYIPLGVWTFEFGSPVFDHNLSFLWICLLQVFLFFFEGTDLNGFLYCLKTKTVCKVHHPKGWARLIAIERL